MSTCAEDWHWVRSLSQADYKKRMLTRGAAALPRGWATFQRPCQFSAKRLSTQISASLSSEHSRYLASAGLNGPQLANLEPLLRVLQAQGQTLVAPDDRAQLHPLAVPLACASAPASDTPNAAVRGEEVFTCLLPRQVGESPNGRLPIVTTSRGAPAVSLVARNANEFMHRALAEEESQAGTAGTPSPSERPIADAAGPDGRALYTAGALQASKLPSLTAYLARHAGMFPDVAEALVTAHLQKDDLMSALITGEWYTRSDHFGGWARPYEFNSQLYIRFGRMEEARDSARTALRLPWWTLSTGFEMVRSVANLTGDAESIRRQLDDSKVRSNLSPEVDVGTLTDAQLAAVEADHIMNLVAAGEATWDDIRQDLAKQYEKAGSSVNAVLATAL